MLTHFHSFLHDFVCITSCLLNLSVYVSEGLLFYTVSDLFGGSGTNIFFSLSIFLHVHRQHLSLPLAVRHHNSFESPRKRIFGSAAKIQGYTKVCELVLLSNKQLHMHTDGHTLRGAVRLGMVSTLGIKYNTKTKAHQQQWLLDCWRKLWNLSHVLETFDATLFSRILHR